MKGIVFLAALVLGLGASEVSAATTQQRAERTYNRLWEKADRFYCAENEPPPVFLRAEPAAPGPGSPLWTEREGSSTTIHARPWAVHLLAGKNKGSGNPIGRKRLMEKGLLHEWAHAFQTTEVYNDPPTAEHGAAQFANALAPQLIRPKGKRRKRIYNPWRDSQQFGFPPATG